MMESQYCAIPQSCTDGTDYKVKITAISSGESFGEFEFSGIIKFNDKDT